MEDTVSKVRAMSSAERTEWAESAGFEMSLSDICAILEAADETED